MDHLINGPFEDRKTSSNSYARSDEMAKINAFAMKRMPKLHMTFSMGSITAI